MILQCSGRDSVNVQYSLLRLKWNDTTGTRYLMQVHIFCTHLCKYSNVFPTCSRNARRARKTVFLLCICLHIFPEFVKVHMPANCCMSPRIFACADCIFLFLRSSLQISCQVLLLRAHSSKEADYAAVAQLFLALNDLWETAGHTNASCTTLFIIANRYTLPSS